MEWTTSELNWIEKNRSQIDSGNLKWVREALREGLNYVERLRILYALAYINNLPIVIENLGYIKTFGVKIGNELSGLGNLSKDENSPIRSFYSHKDLLHLPKNWRLEPIETYSIDEAWKIFG